MSSVIGLIGAYIVQLGDNQRRSEFTKEEVSFMNENKAYSQFTSADKDLASKITHKCTYNSDAVFEQCLPKILTWEAKIYQSYNAHRKISDSEAIKYTEEELRDKHNYWINKNANYPSDPLDLIGLESVSYFKPILNISHFVIQCSLY